MMKHHQQEPISGKIQEKDIKRAVSDTICKILEGDTLGKDVSEKILARAKGLPERLFYYHSAIRLMPMAKKEIEKTTMSGRSFYACACWWAEYLTKARGRLTRTWWAPAGGLYQCIALYCQLLPENRQLYSLAAGLSVCQALRELGIPAEIRWINDILASGKKICGILSETVNANNLSETYLLFGIGLNVNTKDFLPELRSKSTSMFIESGRNWSVLEVGIKVLARLIYNFSLLHQWEASCLESDTPFSERENPIITAYQRLSGLSGRKILYGRDLENQDGTLCVSRGISNDGSLILEENGTIFKVNTGEIRFVG